MRRELIYPGQLIIDAIFSKFWPSFLLMTIKLSKSVAEIWEHGNTQSEQDEFIRCYYHWSKTTKKIVINSVFLQDCVGLVTPKNKKGKSWHLEKYNKIFAMIKIIQRLTMHPFDGWMVIFFF